MLKFCFKVGNKWTITLINFIREYLFHIFLDIFVKEETFDLPLSCLCVKMNSITISVVRPKTSILDRTLSKGKGEVSLTSFALLFLEIIQYCQNRSHSIPELQNK